MHSRSLGSSVIRLFSCFLGLALLASCLSESRSGRVYSQEQARVSHSVFYGTLLRVNDVIIEGSESGAGTLAGGAMGAALGSGVGRGSGQAVAVVGGAIAGAIAGSVLEKQSKTVAGVELEVELDNGEILALVQEKDAVYNVGDRVRLLRDAQGTVRVRP